mgnify:CR=1 FL=1
MGVLTYIVLTIPFITWLIKRIAFRVKNGEEKRWGYKKKPDFIDECVAPTFCVAFLWSATLLLLYGISIYSVNDFKITKSDDYDIVSASQFDKIEGKIFLFGGYVESRPVYKAYCKNEDGSISMRWMYAETTRIVETNEVKPHITEYFEGDRNIKWSKWHSLTLGKENGRVYKRLVHSKNLRHNGTIYIPKGTIKPTFEGLNL